MIHHNIVINHSNYDRVDLTLTKVVGLEGLLEGLLMGLLLVLLKGL